MKLRMFTFVLSVSALASSAQQPSPQVEAMLTKLYAYAAHYRDTLPSLECHESITSQLVVKGKVRQEVKIEGVLRNLWAPDTGHGPFAESHKFDTVDGHPPPAQFNIPYFTASGFANIIGFSRRDQKDCYVYTLTPMEPGQVRLEFTARPHAVGLACRDVPEGYHKSVIAEATTGRVLSVERSMSARAAKKTKDVFSATTIFEPQTLGEETLWLPAVIRSHDGKDEGRMTATYSDFHRYRAKVTIEAVP